MFSVIDIANWFLQKESMEHKKLQKLCYYAQSWSYALKDKPMFDGDFEAWVHGPVNRTLWNSLRYYGYVDVKQDEFSKRANTTFDSDKEELLEDVWETYGKFSSSQLEALTHQEPPWINARKGVATFEPSTNKLNPNDMKMYYRSIYSGEGIGE